MNKPYWYHTKSTQMASSVFDSFNVLEVKYNRDNGWWSLKLDREPKEWELV